MAMYSDSSGFFREKCAQTSLTAAFALDSGADRDRHDCGGIDSGDVGGKYQPVAATPPLD
jgi:hypothetical protein